jgi:predicted ATPase
MPFLNKITFNLKDQSREKYPFNLPFLKEELEIELQKNVRFLVGENGSGKSTILEAVATLCGFNIAGGGKDHFYNSNEKESELANYGRLSWGKRVGEGFFMRAESFYNFATYVDEVGAKKFGDKSLHHQSHGESFLALFYNNFKQGIYLLDEPEAALAPRKLLELMGLIRHLEKMGKAQFIIVTHSPILMSYPYGQVLSLDSGMPTPISYTETDHYQFTTSFLQNPNSYFHHLFKQD